MYLRNPNATPLGANASPEVARRTLSNPRVHLAKRVGLLKVFQMERMGNDFTFFSSTNIIYINGTRRFGI
jgi:hypothetical protein